ncbi:MAG TPA: hypothetical protein VFC93_02600 [Chloroflexota bacterium]|nr:hypothetical protein [Chloroflexota bacterium]
MAASYLRASPRTTADVPAAPTEAIDDLIKFRLVESMLRQPDRPADAAELASRLGFHSVELTAVALDELVAAGVLRAARRGGVLGYVLAPDGAVRAAVADLVAKGPPGLFNRLAAASAARIKRLLKGRRRYAS